MATNAYTDKFTLRAVDDTKAAIASASAGFTKLQGVATSLTGVLGVLSGALAIRQGVQFTKSALEMGASIGVVAEKTGLAAEQLQVLRFAADQNGSSADKLDKAMLRLNASIGQAGREALGLEPTTSRASVALASLGVSTLDAAGNIRSTGDIFPELVDKLAAIQSPAERSAVAAQIFGMRLGPELLKMINQGSSGLAEFEQRLRATGALLSGELADAADSTGDQLSAIGDAITKNFQTGLLIGFTGEFQTLEQAISDPAFVAAVRDVGEQFGAFFRTVVEGGPAVIDYLREIRDITGVLSAVKLGAKFGPKGALAGLGVGLAGVGVLRAQDAERAAQREELAQVRANAAQAERTRDAIRAGREQAAATTARVDTEAAAIARLDVLRAAETRTLKDELKEQTKAHQDATRDIDAALRNREAVERRIAESRANAPGARAPNLLSAVNAGNRARGALDAGDAQAAQREAEAALDLIDQLRQTDPGANLEIVAAKVQATLRAAAEAQVAQAQQAAANIAATIDSLKAQAQILENLPVGFASDQTITDAQSLRAALEAELAKPIVVPVVIQNTAAPAAENAPARARGGYIPGRSPHPRADNILIRATAGEYMLPVGAVQRLSSTYGAGVLEQLRRGHLPGYADGGPVRQLLAGAAPARPNLTAGLAALPAAPTTTINLTLPTGQTYTVRADTDTAKTLQRDIRMQALKAGTR